MRCDDVRPLLAELAEGVPHPAGKVELHLASCPSCSAELRRYRALLSALSAFRDAVTEPEEGFLEGILAEIPEAVRRRTLQRLAADERVHYAAFSLGGAAVGAMAMGILWWRAARRTLGQAAEG